MSDMVSGFDPDAIEQQLGRILRSAKFANSPRLTIFLKYVVAQSMEPNETALKESILGIEVFGKKAGWDSSGLSVVRTAGGRLRARLKEYYAIEGLNDPIIIVVEEGGYVAKFLARATNERQERSAHEKTADHPLDGAHQDCAPQPVANAGEPQGDVRTTLCDQNAGPRVWMRYSPQLVIGASAIVLMVAVWHAIFGLAAVAICMAALFSILEYMRAEDTAIARATVAVVILAAMAYVPSALTSIELFNSIINMDHLPPAAAYPFITGLKFIPLFALLIGFWPALKFSGDESFQKHPGLKKVYTIFGLAFLAATAASLLTNSGDYRIWLYGGADRWFFAAGYAVILLMNLIVWVVGYRFFNRASMGSYRSLFSRFVLSYIPVLFMAFLIDHQYNVFNQRNLDVRRPQPYVAENPNALDNLPGVLSAELKDEVGPSLARLLNDPGFHKALRSERFFKQNFDEPFQARGHAVIFGYRPPSDQYPNRHSFVIVRFPQELADALGFKAVDQ